MSAQRMFSIEFFPPNTQEGVEKLRAVRAQLVRLGPAFFSVTHGAGGSTRDKTVATVLEIQHEGLSAAPHISAMGSTRDSIRELLKLYRDAGIRRLIALRSFVVPFTEKRLLMHRRKSDA